MAYQTETTMMTFSHIKVVHNCKPIKSDFCTPVKQLRKC